MGYAQVKKGLHNKADSSVVSLKKERNENNTSAFGMGAAVIQAKLYRAIQFKQDSDLVLQMQEGEEEGEQPVAPVPPHLVSFEALQQYFINNLIEEKIAETALLAAIPAGLPDEFVSSDNIHEGHKYSLTLPDIEKNPKSVIIKWHSPDRNALSKNSTGNSATGWTAQLRFGNRLLTQSGGTKRKPDNDTHIPVIR